MPEMSAYPAGVFCWVDLATSDANAGKQFYTEVFEWEAADVPAGRAGVYTTFSRSGKSIAALYQMQQEKQSIGVPPHWTSYVAVEDADAVAARVADLGGTVHTPAFDVMDAGRMSIVADSTGAPFALWQPRRHLGAALVNEPGSWCWNELYTTDVVEATDFYGRLFGWTAKTSKSPTGDDYTEFTLAGRPIGGMLAIKPEWGDVPPNWVIYLAVADLDETLETAKRLGGSIEFAPLDVPGVGRFAFIEDPQGAFLAVIQLLPNAA